MKTVTIITPSYNRAHTLPQCYKSLKKQTSSDFVWLIVDDGSVDDTKQLVLRWMQEDNRFQIVYLKKENGGKASALNLAFQNLETPYACILDSDDYLVDSALESFLRLKEQVDKDATCCGVMAFRHNEDGTVMGGREIPLGNRRITMIDVLNHNFRTELFCFYKTSIISKMQFPIFPGEKFVSPQWLDFELARHFYFIPSSSHYCICTYIADGLTKNKRNVIIKNPHGYTAVKKQSFEFSDSLLLSIKHGIMYDYGCVLGKDKKWLKNSPKKFLSVLLMPLAYGVYLKRYRG